MEKLSRNIHKFTKQYGRWKFVYGIDTKIISDNTIIPLKIDTTIAISTNLVKRDTRLETNSKYWFLILNFNSSLNFLEDIQYNYSNRYSINFFRFAYFYHLIFQSLISKHNHKYFIRITILQRWLNLIETDRFSC